ncbi:DUF4150 domain-containing protein [Enterobacter mori]|uniref:DUF4150 domain-containing protein n=1 Tax=Enterobacter mori TaxID=539813 RepID=A0A7T0DUR3_9ENTR|nr:PAAR-like domain-containing protein [Enterobacter mori]QPJ99863.1 DUF4150 domain-containing protein [Enterobacter mori]
MITININGLTLCHKGSGGVSHNTMPDVCKTPSHGTPVPYENEAYSSDLIKGTVSVFADGGNMIANMGSQFARSVLDEPGSMGGVISGTNKAETDWISHSFDVFFEGKPACRLTDKLFMNHRNTMNMAGLMQDYISPVPELEDESCIPPRDDDKKSEPAMPCIVILVHGVNDVGEAYQNQDEGICKGLNTRLGRTDLNPHTWPAETFMISDVGDNVANSPVIPFYWGYKPVDKATWEADQTRYRDELREKRNKTDLPYDTYRQDDEKILHAHNDENIDNLNNWLDKKAHAKGGGTFANATTSIPDMFGPGADGAALDVVGAISRSKMNGGDWSHPIYANPHRIYQAYAARRLADLILAIRKNESSKKDTINIVAHSQGTIVTMLANLWVKAEGEAPVDCVILNNSPYSLESRTLENAQPGNQQTDAARQQTVANFCKVMSENARYNGGQSHKADETEQLLSEGCLSDSGKEKWGATTYNRNNFGLVYNYFCPNDQVVSMLPVQGMGWRGIPDNISVQMGANLRQRAFCKDVNVGDKTGEHFVMPGAKQNDPEIPVQDAKYTYQDVTVSGAVLPEPFVFELQGQKEGYKAPLTGNDPDIARAARKAEDFPEEVLDVPDTAGFRHLHNGRVLNEAQLAELSAHYRMDVVSGWVEGDYGPSQRLRVKRYANKDELDVVARHEATYSQHSSVVCSADVQLRAVPYDLAIGRNVAFKDEAFWKSLLLQADWRRPENSDDSTRKYYAEGILPKEFKDMMNKPETGEKPMPTGENGVVNNYGPRQRVKPGNKQDTENQMEDVLQWDMPRPQV